jgi:hypothetical protein
MGVVRLVVSSIAVLGTGCALHLGTGAAAFRTAEPVAIGPDSDVSGEIRSYELNYHLQVPSAIAIVGASAVVGDAHAREVGAAVPVVRESALGGIHAVVGVAVPVGEIERIRFAPYASYSRRLLGHEQGLRSATELGVEVIPREPWSWFGSRTMRHGFAFRVGAVFASSGFDYDPGDGYPSFSGRGLVFSLCYRLLFAEQKGKWL